MSKGLEIKNLSAIEIAFEIKKIGVTESIILELTRVGSSKGVSLKYVSDIIKETNLEIITGGGVKSPQDLIELDKFNISGLLIATAFHDGSITPDDIKEFH